VAPRHVALQTTALADAENTRQPRIKILTASLRIRKTGPLLTVQPNSLARIHFRWLQGLALLRRRFADTLVDRIIPAFKAC
jgi:hypothetical protein